MAHFPIAEVTAFFVATVFVRMIMAAMKRDCKEDFRESYEDEGTGKGGGQKSKRVPKRSDLAKVEEEVTKNKVEEVTQNKVEEVT
jgi:hypothetical protein